MALPTLEARNLHRIGSELGFLEDTLALQPASKPEHFRAWIVWLRDMDKQWVSLLSRPGATAPLFLTFATHLSTERVPWYPQERWLARSTHRRAPRKRAEGPGP